MDLLTILVSAAIRALTLAAFAQLMLSLCRVRSASARHATWTAVTAGMLLLLVLTPMLPPLALRILPPAPYYTGLVIVVPGDFDGRAPFAPSPSGFWTRLSVAVLLYSAVVMFLFARLAAGYWFTYRLVRRSRPVEVRGVTAYESTDLAVPMTVGWLRPRILLPATWMEWEPGKLNAVLAHEQAHIGRADWLVAVMSRVNRCIFWFHPLAFWMERRLTSLAEEACDDSALRAVNDRGVYAQALLEVAQDARLSGGRFLSGSTAMAKGANVRERVERILDDARPIPAASGRRFAALLIGAAIPAIYFASAVRLQARPRVLQTRSLYAFAQSQPPALTPYQKWVTEDVVYIINDQERDAFNRLTTDEERQHFIEQFWQRRPGIKEEHYRRIAYANERYRFTAGPGWKSARGRIYITLGPPDQIESHPSGGSHERLYLALGTIAAPAFRNGPASGKTFPDDDSPFEIWFYRDARYGFTDPNRLGEYAIVLSQENGSQLMGPAVLETKPVEFTKEELAAGSPGVVVLSAVIGVNGGLQSVRVTQSLHPRLDQRAIECVRKWRFTPGTKDGIPIPTAISIHLSIREEQ